MKKIITVFLQDVRAWILIIAVALLGGLATNHSTEIEVVASEFAAATPFQSVLMGVGFIVFLALVIHCFSDETENNI